jgi:hypothetical protein
MFERYTEKARRVIFFARYEASAYGSKMIETEHLLLGLLREDWPLLERCVGSGANVDAIRAEIDKQIPRKQSYSTSVEVPLSADAKRALNFVAEEAERLAHRRVETGHLLIGLSSVEGSVPSKFLLAKGVKREIIRENVAIERIGGLRGVEEAGGTAEVERVGGKAVETLNHFLEGLKSMSSRDLISYFAEKARFIDVSGRRLGPEQIEKEFETLFAPYAKKNAVYVVEPPHTQTRQVFVGSVVWKNALLASEQCGWMQRDEFRHVVERRGLGNCVGAGDCRTNVLAFPRNGSADHS